jgi:undecaprenyl diphosphate synthase
MAATFDAGVEFMSIYVFSTENWKRSEDEVNKLMKLILSILTNDLKEFKTENVRLMVLGSKDNLSDKIIKAIGKAEKETEDCTRGTLAICFNYGGQQEIVDAVKKIVQSGVKPEKIDRKLIEGNLYSPEVPPLDLLVRTSGEQRISNFMLWRAAYSEMMFLDKPWPDMTKRDVKTILQEYSKRQRRFGG